MPMIVVHYMTPRPHAGLKAEIAQRAARLAAECLGKDPAVTAVLVKEAAPGEWFIAGREPAAQGYAAFWLDIKVTHGTNTKAEATAFVRMAYDEMAELLGPVNSESYVYVHAADGDAYGYGGRTQNGRWAATHPG